MDPEKKKKIRGLIRQYGFDTVYQDFWDWWDLAEEYNQDELRFLYEDN